MSLIFQCLLVGRLELILYVDLASRDEVSDKVPTVVELADKLIFEPEGNQVEKRSNTEHR